jgi:adenylosuccinate lyase
MAERLMLLLTQKGMGRQDAHELLRNASRRALKNGMHLRDVLCADKRVLSYLSRPEIDAAFREEPYIGKAVEIVERAVKQLS